MKWCIKNSWLITLLFSMAYIVHAGDVHSLYTDHRAMKKDDILTVLIVENAKAESQSSTSTNKKNSFGVENVEGSGALRFIPSFGASGGTKVGYDGKGSTAREGELVATISARVVEVMDNGNLRIDGNKVVEINEEKEIIKISGIVRPEDIESDNTVFSCNISEAKITYSGKGVANKGRRPGLIARFLNWIF